MSFLSFLIQYKWVLLFYLVVCVVVYLNRKKFDVEAKFFYIYRTKVGLKIIDRLSRFKKTLHILGKIGTVFGFGGIFYVTVVLAKKTYEVILNPQAMGVAPILPGLPIAGTGLQFPFVIGWISLFLIIVIHEFSHGVVAKSFNIPVKSSGIAFFGPILGAFVEPDEKKLQKQRPIVQNAVFAAGPIANIVTGFIFMLILGYLILPGVGAITARDGIIVSPINGTPAFAAGLPNETKLAYANGYKIEGLSDFFNFSIGLKPNDTVVLKSLEGNEYSLTTVKNPQNASIGYMGLSYIKTIERPSQPGILHQLGFSVGNWLSELFLWLYFISINLGLVNLFPIFITDGARMLQTAVPKLVKDKKRSFAVWKIINQFCVLLILVLLLLPWIRKLFHF